MQNFFKDYILNNNVELTPAEFQRAVLTVQLSLIEIAVSLFYISLEFYAGKTLYLPFYLILTLGGLSSLLLIRNGFYSAAKFILLFAALILLALFSSVEPYLTGNYMLYIVVCVGAYTLFGYESLKLGMVLIGLSLSIFVLTYFTDFNLIPPMEATAEYVKLSFAANFLITISSCALMIYYIIAMNHRSEKEMRANEERLMKLTAELIDSKNRFELAIQGSSAGIWDWSLGDRNIYLSPILQEILGYTPGELDSVDYEAFLDSVHPYDLDELNFSLREHLINKKIFRLEFRLKRKDGSYIWALDSGQAMWDKTGKPIKMVGSIFDITDRVNSEKQILLKNQMLEKANRELDKFLYSTSHDLRGPMRSILGLINICHKANDIDEIKSFIAMMNTSVQKFERYLVEITDFVRNSRIKLNYEKFNFENLIEDVLNEIYTINNGIKIHKDFCSNYQINSDKERLRIVIKNLLENSIKYHNKNQNEPFIRIQVRTNCEYEIIEISDNGTGINHEVKPKVFDMFYRGSELSDGPGLGLYIVKEIIEKMDGKVNLSSQERLGSSFTLKIPIVKSNN